MLSNSLSKKKEIIKHKHRSYDTMNNHTLKIMIEVSQEALRPEEMLSDTPIP